MPYLVCDPPPAAEQVDYYTIVGLPGNPRVEVDESVTEFGFKYNLEGIPTGSYSLRVSACNAWTCSLPAPFDFTAPETPSEPVGLNILFGV